MGLLLRKAHCCALLDVQMLCPDWPRQINTLTILTRRRCLSVCVTTRCTLLTYALVQTS